MKFGRFTDKNGNNVINYNQLEIQYPVNKVEIFYDDDDHSNWLGFTWQLVCIGRTPVGIDVNDTDFNTIGKTGGSKYLQGHQHRWGADNDRVFVGAYGWTSIQTGGSTSLPSADDARTITGGVHGMQTGNSGNLQPYEVVAFWRRIA